VTDADEVRVYYPDGATETMTRRAHRAKLVAWLDPLVRAGDRIETSRDGASVRVFRRGDELPPPERIVPWVYDYNSPSRIDLDFPALRNRADIRIAVAQRAFKDALFATIALILRWLSARLTR